MELIFAAAILFVFLGILLTAVLIFKICLVLLLIAAPFYILYKNTLKM